MSRHHLCIRHQINKSSSTRRPEFLRSTRSMRQTSIRTASEQNRNCLHRGCPFFQPATIATVLSRDAAHLNPGTSITVHVGGRRLHPTQGTFNTLTGLAIENYTLPIILMSWMSIVTNHATSETFHTIQSRIHCFNPTDKSRDPC